MAAFRVEGMESIESFFENLATVPERVIDDMLTAEAAVVAAAQKRTAREMLKGKYATGQIEKSVKPSKPRKLKGVKVISIEFAGSRKRGKRKTSETTNAEIAFINEYGKRGQPARPFIKTANEQAADDAVKAAAAIYDEYVDSLTRSK
jgi:HK97 gp10 family phage protein